MFAGNCGVNPEEKYYFSLNFLQPYAMKNIPLLILYFFRPTSCSGQSTRSSEACSGVFISWQKWPLP